MLALSSGVLQTAGSLTKKEAGKAPPREQASCRRASGALQGRRLGWGGRTFSLGDVTSYLLLHTASPQSSQEEAMGRTHTHYHHARERQIPILLTKRSALKSCSVCQNYASPPPPPHLVIGLLDPKRMSALPNKCNKHTISMSNTTRKLPTNMRAFITQQVQLILKV